MFFLHNRTGPVCWEIRTTYEEDREEEWKGPDDDYDNHHPGHDVEAGSGVAGEDAPVEEDEGELYEA